MILFILQSLVRMIFSSGGFIQSSQTRDMDLNREVAQSYPGLTPFCAKECRLDISAFTPVAVALCLT